MITFRRQERMIRPETPSPRRIAAARRVIERDKDNYALFPQFVKYNTPEERLAAKDAESVAYWQQIRNHNAKVWRETRRLLRTLHPITREGLLRYWKESWCPKEAHYLAGMVHQILKGESPWTWLRKRRQVQLIGQHRLPPDIAQRILAE